MNTIQVTAIGQDGSFVRRVQHDPAIAVGLLDALKSIGWARRGTEEEMRDANDLAEIARKAVADCGMDIHQKPEDGPPACSCPSWVLADGLTLPAVRDPDCPVHGPN